MIKFFKRLKENYVITDSQKPPKNLESCYTFKTLNHKKSKKKKYITKRRYNKYNNISVQPF